MSVSHFGNSHNISNVSYKCLKSDVYFTFTTHHNSDSPCFKCSIATCGRWLVATELDSTNLGSHSNENTQTFRMSDYC